MRGLGVGCWEGWPALSDSIYFCAVGTYILGYVFSCLYILTPFSKIGPVIGMT